jgi:hypothetical protein
MRKSALIAALFLLAGCDQKSEVEEVLNAAFGLEPNCYRSEEPPELPLRVRATRDHQPVLEGLLGAKLITVEADPVARVPTWVINVTQAGIEAKVWTPGKGFCVGRKIVHTIDNIEDWPDTLTVDYSWRYEPADWAKTLNMPGIFTFVKARAALGKTKDGLKVRVLY